MNFNSGADLNAKQVAKDKQWLHQLWEAGCSVTIQMRLCPAEKDNLLARNHASEMVMALKKNAGGLSETFLSFARLVKQLNIETVQQRKDVQLRFNNAEYNGSMHKAAVAVASMLERDTSFADAMLRLELAWGRELLSYAYSKLHRLIALAKAQGSGDRSSEQVAGWLVDHFNLALKLKITHPSRTTEAWLDRDRKHGQPGFWPSCLLLLEASKRACCVLHRTIMKDHVQEASTLALLVDVVWCL